MRPTRLLICVLACAAAGAVPSAEAQLGARPADAWVELLESPQRVAGLKVDEVVRSLGLKPGAVVADIGAGAGVFEGALAGAVGPGGAVYAVDIDQALLDHISSRARKVGLTNVHVVLGKFTDPGLPVRNVDVALIYDVLHHIEQRGEYLKNLAAYMSPSGRIAVVDFLPGRGHGNDATQQITREQTDGWMAAAGFKSAQELKMFEEKWFVVYSR